MTRLAAATLGSVAAGVPSYDRTRPPAIVHLGPGAFFRAHLAVYADDLLARGHRAGIHAISLASTRAAEELAPQDGWCSVTTRTPDRPDATRVLGSITAVSSGADSAVAAIAAASTELVTLTVTEHGYDRAGREAVPGVLAAALAERRRRHGTPLVVASLDNLQGNGRLLRRRVEEELAELGDDQTADWVAEHVHFPDSVVDRMVPAATDDDRAAVAAHLGVEDRAAVVAEPHRSWYLEAVPLPLPLTEVGVELVGDLTTLTQRKLWLLNGPHSALALAGLHRGCVTVADAAADAELSTWVGQLVADTLVVFPDVSVSPAAFAASARLRFTNPALGHRCAQVAADGSRKLPERILPVMARRRERGLTSPAHAVVVARWLASVSGLPFGRRPVPKVADPAQAELRALAEAGDLEVLARAALGPFAGLADEVLPALALGR